MSKFIKLKLTDYLPGTFLWSTSHVHIFQNSQPNWNCEIIEDRRTSELILRTTDDPETTSFSRQQFLLSGHSLPEINDKIFHFLVYVAQHCTKQTQVRLHDVTIFFKFLTGSQGRSINKTCHHSQSKYLFIYYNITS